MTRGKDRKETDVDEREWLARRFAEHRPRLLAAAYRMLGSASEADDAVQEAWLRLDRTHGDAVENLPAWLTTVVARVCLNMLRARASRREQPLDAHTDRRPDGGEGEADPAQEALLADSVGLALLVVLDTLAPAERLAFVLHDMFDLPFDQIAPVVGRSPAAARQLASRARRRVRGSAVPEADRGRQRRVVDAYLAATRDGDFEALLALLDPDVVLRADPHAVPSGVPTLLRGAQAVARGATASSARARHTQLALVNGRVGLVMALSGHLTVVLDFTIAGDKITEIDVIAAPERLQQLDLAELDS
ncbi:MAG: sigma-70 family RNA polymerase sigma factor [Streptosporangiaceae bacterium]